MENVEVSIFPFGEMRLVPPDYTSILHFFVLDFLMHYMCRMW